MDPKPKSLTELLKDPVAASRAHQETAAARAAVPKEKLRPVSIDVPLAMVTVMTAAETTAAFLPTIKQMPTIRFELVTDVPKYALALLHADGKIGSGSDRAKLDALLAEGVPLRAAMFKWLPTLVDWGIYTPEQVKAWKAGSGHADLGGDLVNVGGALVKDWAKVQGKMPLTREQIERGVEVGNGIFMALGIKEGRTETQPLIEDRQRAMFVLDDAYGELRAALAFLRRREGDADELAPSIYTSRREHPTPKARSETPAPA